MRRSETPRDRPPLESLLFLVGTPLSHSLSPAMHNAVIARRGLPLRYVPIELAREALPAFLRVVRSANILGGNVTIPYKEEAARLADIRSEAVRFCGAANVLAVRRGRIRAENTDGPGFLDALASLGWGTRFRRVVLLGAGGAARGIAYALGRRGTRELVVLNRNVERAEGLAASLASRCPRVRLSAGELSRARMLREFPGADLIVQSTALGLKTEWRNFPVEGVKPGTRVADIVYRRGGTALVRELRRRGVPAVDGLPMLASQAARSFTVWTGIRVPAEEFLRAARRSRGPGGAKGS
ncbi:MAG: shikimate dehydrogenase [Deltaproteobacteria bacterium]